MSDEDDDKDARDLKQLEFAVAVAVLCAEGWEFGEIVGGEHGCEYVIRVTHRRGGETKLLRAGDIEQFLFDEQRLIDKEEFARRTGGQDRCSTQGGTE